MEFRFSGKQKGYHLRNSSIRMKPENQQDELRKKLSDRTIARLL